MGNLFVQYRYNPFLHFLSPFYHNITPLHPSLPLSPPLGFLLVGSSKALLDLAPKGICTIQLSLLPLYTGFVPLPHIRVTWERNGAAVVSNPYSTNHPLTHYHRLPISPSGFNSLLLSP